MSIKSFVIRSVRKLIDHVETKPRLIHIETDEQSGPMHDINEMLKKKYTYRYKTLGYSDCIIEAITTIDSDKIAGEIRSFIGHRYDVTVNDVDIMMIPKKNDK